MMVLARQAFSGEDDAEEFKKVNHIQVGAVLSKSRNNSIEGQQDQSKLQICEKHPHIQVNLVVG